MQGCEACDQVLHEFIKNHPSGGSYFPTELMCEYHREEVKRLNKYPPMHVSIPAPKETNKSSTQPKA